MNTNSNTYTVVYSAIIVIVVASILALAATSLKDRQVANMKAETISQILSAAKIPAGESNAEIIALAMDSGSAVVWGDVFAVDSRITRDNNHFIMSISITDYTGSVNLKIFDEIANKAKKPPPFFLWAASAAPTANNPRYV